MKRASTTAEKKKDGMNISAWYHEKISISNIISISLILVVLLLLLRLNGKKLSEVSTVLLWISSRVDISEGTSKII